MVNKQRMTDVELQQSGGHPTIGTLRYYISMNIIVCEREYFTIEH